MKAQWLLTTHNGLHLRYFNLVDNILFDCGVASGGNGTLDEIIEFAKNEGAMNGDGVYVNGSLLCIIKDTNGTHSTYCN